MTVLNVKIALFKFFRSKMIFNHSQKPRKFMKLIIVIIIFFFKFALNFWSIHQPTG